MKTLKSIIIILCVIVITSCSTETDSTEIVNEVFTAANSRAQKETPVVFLEELHYRSLINAADPNYDLINEYQAYFDYLGGIPKCGPKPKPCDSGGSPLSNCKAFIFETADFFRTFAFYESVSVEFYDYQGDFVNGLAGFENIKCPKKNVFDGYFENPLEGCGYMKIAFESELTGGMVEFELDYVQQFSDCY